MFTDKEILEEIKKIQYFHGLKLEIRYGEGRTDLTESVAEHIYGMHVLSLYFLELEDPQNTWAKARIYEMITWHDIDELETGDIIGYKKTDADKAREKHAIKHVFEKAPVVITGKIRSIIEEYQEQTSIESHFVKALDKIEPIFQIYNENGKRVLIKNKTTHHEHHRIKDVYVKDFPYMKKFNDVISLKMEKEGFFTQDT